MWCVMCVSWQVLTDLLRFNMPNLVHLQLTHMGVLFVMDRFVLPGVRV